jgi:transcriptional regulator
MFIPSEFAETRLDEIKAIVTQFPLATIVAVTDQGLVANHLPVLVDKPLDAVDTDQWTGRFIGHLSRRNSLHQTVGDGAAVLMIFQAENSYISPNWYPSKFVHHRHVPTWNYQAVHCYGRIRFVDDDKALRGIVGRMTKFFETAYQQDKAWKMADAPADFLAYKLAGIIGFTIDIDRCFAKSKMSQNRDKGDFDNVAAETDAAGLGFMAQSMRGAGKSD